MYALTPALQTYDWGDATAIPRLLGTEPPGGPVAEAWWGAHPAAPAVATARDGASLPLDALIAKDPVGALGADVAERFDGRLPYLLKVLAIAKPLSLQVHPSEDQARRGFDEDERLGLPIDDPARTYRDPNHKPEMILAVTPMTVLSGFRPVAELVADLALMDADGARVLEGVLGDADDEADAISEYIDACLRGIVTMPVLTSLKAAVAAGRGSDAMHAAANALDAHPGDPGALVVLAMNVVTLEPGDAVFTADGVVHSYQSGVGVEIMANSDNVIRAGLTSKPIDVGRLLYLANAEPEPPEVPRESTEGPVRTLRVPADEFALAVVSDGDTALPRGPRMVLAIDGEATLVAGGESRTLRTGEAAFVPASDGPLAVTVRGLATLAWVPTPEV
ncbi:mannose-6-phosphate isomerase, class I [Demequina sp. NBRC 110052]|uniref:mannose-6-phosphate isomerase, class I n=1 Tax=Demequina sp. NBRC 110052 TaxID=1570341 RepID=UPI0013562A52|nr:mannose-6-phosphate isomerase, class I [Demequina sp. NBRC 110052]